MLSTSSLLHESLIEFCDISNPDTETPPALAALPGPYKIFASRNTSTASGVDGIFAPSLIHIHPLEINVLASSPFNSFCVAEGIAISAVLEMGEVDEAQPLCLVEDISQIEFVDHSPTKEELEMARVAWKYIENNFNEKTGLTAAAHKYPSAATWD